jgi:hypothetical protein
MDCRNSRKIDRSKGAEQKSGVSGGCSRCSDDTSRCDSCHSCCRQTLPNVNIVGFDKLQIKPNIAAIKSFRWL